jgi:biopolymer transport protein ExbB
MRSTDISIQDAIGALENGGSPIQSRGLRSQLVAEFLEERSGAWDVDREILRQCAMRQRWRLTRYLAVIAVLAGAAPLMGLLGTVLGMIETFDVIALFGTGNARALASGISVALVTTQTGLLIAIPGLFFSGTLARQSRNLSTRLDEIVAILDRTLLGRKKRAEREKKVAELEAAALLAETEAGHDSDESEVLIYQAVREDNTRRHPEPVLLAAARSVASRSDIGGGGI